MMTESPLLCQPRGHGRLKYACRTYRMVLPLAKAPTAVLAALHGHIEKAFTRGHDQVILRLVRTVLNRDVEAILGEQVCSQGLGCDANVPDSESVVRHAAPLVTGYVKIPPM